MIVEIFFVLCTIYVINQIFKAKRAEEFEEAFEEAHEKLKKVIIPSRIEKVGSILLLYNRETNEFIAQGESMNELQLNAKTRFPDKLFNVPQVELDEYEQGKNYNA